VSGTATVTNGERQFVVEMNHSTYIPAGNRHRLENRTTAPLAVPAAYDLAPGAPEGPAANVTRLYAAFAADRRAGTPGATAPDFAHALRAHHTLDFITSAAVSGIAQRPVTETLT